jgi:hypothetical protein
MPIRRMSVSAEHAISSQSSIRAHRSNDSHHLHTTNGAPTHPPSIAYSGASTTPQQKMVVQALINRLKNKVGSPFLHSRPFITSHSCLKKLPINSGLSLDVVESDPATQGAVCALMEIAHDSLDIISWSLSEQLERLAKVPSPTSTFL